MTRVSAADFLIRTVLDDAFRELAVADPQRAFEGYDLNDEERDILRARDGRLLGLLGHAVEQDVASEEPTESEDDSPTSAQPLPNLLEVKLLLRLTPYVAQDAESGARISYEASLQPWPGGQEANSNDPQPDHETEHDDQGPPAEIKWMVRITPNVVGSEEAGLMVSYAASIHPLAERIEEQRPSTLGPAPKSARPPWYHHADSSAAKAAARAVRASAPSRRYEKLLELIHAIQTGDDRG